MASPGYDEAMKDFSRWAVIGSALILILLFFQGLGKSSQTSDFSDYYNASRLLTERKDIYQVDSLKELLSGKNSSLQMFDSEVMNKILSLKGKVASYIYPPVFAFLLIPLSILNYETASAIFNILNFVCLLGVIWMFRQDFDTSRFSVVLFFTLAASYRFLESHTANNQVAFMLIFLTAAALRIKNDFASGFLLALATVIKLTPAIFILYYIYEKRFKALAFFAVGMGFWSALPFLTGYEYGLAQWKNWIELVLQNALKNPVFRAWKNNQSLVATLAKYFHSAADPENQYKYGMPFISLSLDQIKIILNICTLAVLSPLFLFWKKGFSRNQLISILFILSAVLSGVSWIHSFSVLIFPVFYLFCCLEKNRRGAWAVYTLGALTILTSGSISKPVENAALMFSILLYISLGYYALCFYISDRNADLST